MPLNLFPASVTILSKAPNVKVTIPLLSNKRRYDFIVPTSASQLDSSLLDLFLPASVIATRGHNFKHAVTLITVRTFSPCKLMIILADNLT